MTNDSNQSLADLLDPSRLSGAPQTSTDEDSDEDIAAVVEGENSDDEEEEDNEAKPVPPIEGVGVVADLIKAGVTIDEISKAVSDTKKKATKEQKQAQRKAKIELQEQNRPSYPEEELQGFMKATDILKWLKESSHVGLFVGVGVLQWCFEVPKKQAYRLVRSSRGKNPIPAMIDTQNRLIIGDWDKTVNDNSSASS